VFRAIAIIQQTTAAHFLRLADAQVKEREDRLRAFNRAVSHEIKNQVGTILGASDVLHEVSDLSDEQRGRFASIISTNARTMRVTIENLTALSRMDNDARQHRHVRLPEAVAESTRQLRERAQSCGVTVTVTGELPDVEVNAAAVELALNNLISNAIKYSDHGRSVRVVQVGARLEDQALVVEVRDNGLGVPVEKRDRLFQRFFRAHETVTRAEGTGLGLSIVREAVESLGGKAWAAFPDEGSVFAFSLPMRRETGERRAERPTTLGSRTEENAALRAP
jgi:signal transduction histidine kinase